jgi:hypothetical protein
LEASLIRSRSEARQAASRGYQSLSIPVHPVRLLNRSDLHIEVRSLSDAGYAGVSSEENTMTQPISPCLWFDGNAEDAVNYYV